MAADTTDPFMEIRQTTCSEDCVRLSEDDIFAVKNVIDNLIPGAFVSFIGLRLGEIFFIFEEIQNLYK